MPHEPFLLGVGVVFNLLKKPCPSFLWCFCFLGVFLAAKFLRIFECFLLTLQGFLGFAKWEDSLVFLRFSLVFSKKPRKRRTGRSPKMPIAPTPREIPSEGPFNVRGFENLAVIWGGAKRMGGGKRTRERALPKIFGPLQKSFWSALSWILYKKNRALAPEGGGKRTVRGGGVQNPFLGGVSFARFSTPLFFPPPHRVLWDQGICFVKWFLVVLTKCPKYSQDIYKHKLCKTPGQDCPSAEAFVVKRPEFSFWERGFCHAPTPFVREPLLRWISWGLSVPLNDIATRIRNPISGMKSVCSKIHDVNLGARQKGDSKWEKPVSAKICGFLRFPVKICGFLRFSAQICASQIPWFTERAEKSAKISKNLRKCAFWVRFLLFAVSLLARPEH